MAGFAHSSGVNPLFDGELDETGEVVDAQLLHQATAVCLDGLEGKGEDTGDLIARFALDDKPHHLPFVWRGARQWAHRSDILATAQVVIDQLLLDSLAQVAVTVPQR